MTADESLAVCVAEWQRKHGIADGDPMIAMLDLVRVYLKHSRRIDDDPDSPPPAFDDFRSTIELLDKRSKSFIQQSADVMGELRRFAQTVERINQARLLTLLAFTGLGVVVGLLIGRALWI
jgi:hypothetical protein